MIEHTNGKSPKPINIFDQSKINVRLCHDVCQPKQTLATSTQITLLLKRLKFSKKYFYQRIIFCEGKMKNFI
jgi:hypothetical protein